MSRDLNKLIVQRRSVKMSRAGTYIKIIFQPSEIVATIHGALRNPTTTSTVGCIAWLSHPLILREIGKKPTAIVVTNDKANWRKPVREMYKKLRPLEGERKAIKFVGDRKGMYRCKMHHKFLIGLHNGTPQWLLFGSFNFSKQATKNLENIMMIQDPEIAATYYDEWQRIWNCI